MQTQQTNIPEELKRVCEKLKEIADQIPFHSEKSERHMLVKRTRYGAYDLKCFEGERLVASINCSEAQVGNEIAFWLTPK